MSDINLHSENHRDYQPPGHPNDRGVLETIREIKSSIFDPKRLSPEDRQACVMHLGLEGLSVPEIAQVMKVSDRTVARDRKAIQEVNAIEHDPKLAGQFAGRLATEAEACINRIRRVTRDKETPPGVKVEGERSCFEILDKLTQRLQSLGFIPTAAQQIQADLTHHPGEPMPASEMIAELQRLEQIDRHMLIDSQAKPIEKATHKVTTPEPGTQEKGETPDGCT